MIARLDSIGPALSSVTRLSSSRSWLKPAGVRPRTASHAVVGVNGAPPMNSIASTMCVNGGGTARFSSDMAVSHTEARLEPRRHCPHRIALRQPRFSIFLALMFDTA